MWRAVWFKVSIVVNECLSVRWDLDAAPVNYTGDRVLQDRTLDSRP